VLKTTVTLTGSSQIALARNPRPRANTAVARRDPAQPYDQPYSADQQYNAAGEPVQLTPQPQLLPGRRVEPQAQVQVQPDDGYIYPADGSSNEARYPAPRGNRRLYDAQAYPQPQPYGNRGYAPQYPAPQGYYQQQQPNYQPRGFFN
jgi:hypothetical protein